MCGIFLEVLDAADGDASRLWPRLEGNLARRGPDGGGRATVELQNGKKVFLASSVLWLQGDELTEQPKREYPDGDGGGILLWNGDVFAGPVLADEGASDTDAVFRALEAAEDVGEVVAAIRGPFAFAYLRPRENRLWFGRDVFGRHCLLAAADGRPGGQGFFLSSTADVGMGEEVCVEVPALGVFEKDLSSGKVTLMPWSDTEISSINDSFRFEEDRERVMQCPVRLPTRESRMISGRDEWVSRALSENWESAKIVSKFLEEHEDIVQEFLRVLQDAVRVRVSHRPDYCKQCIGERLSWDGSVKCVHAKVSVLFSGGLDSTVLAALADIALEDTEEPLDLVNVAFRGADAADTAPDRITARQGHVELVRGSRSGRRINLVEVNITKEELVRSRNEEISSLLHPSSLTVLDDSIGCALWFAARGRGGTGYTSPARVLLVGAGADEQLGGYSRHRTKFGEGGLSSLTSELRLELSRLWHRNLGRDNRVLAAHGAAPRAPFLDEAVVNFLSAVSTDMKMDLRLGRGAGEKLLLRAVALTLGLRVTATEAKRAIQFGSRIAKMEVRKEKGHQTAVRA